MYHSCASVVLRPWKAVSGLPGLSTPVYSLVLTKFHQVPLIPVLPDYFLSPNFWSHFHSEELTQTAIREKG
jgi:hypothetical protein